MSIINNSPESQGMSRFIPQSYRAMNRGDMLVPSGAAVDTSRFLMAAMRATPWPGPFQVHAVPITYRHPGPISRPQRVGLATPSVVVPTNPWWNRG